MMRFDHVVGRLCRVLTLAAAVASVSQPTLASGSPVVTPPAPNMQNAIALPVPYEEAMRSLQARSLSQTAAPVITGAPAGVHALAAAKVSAAASSVSCTPPAAAAELVELARSLKYNPDLIYEYVYDNIETLPQYGSLKGPLGTLLDGKGTSFDQAELMYVLLQQSCYTPVYETGQVMLTAPQYQAWLGTDTTWGSLGYVLGTGGFPASSIAGSTSNVTAVTVGWAWVKVAINGTNYVFDPATKGYNRSAPLSNLATAMGYTQSAFLSSAESGVSLNSSSLSDVSGLNRTNLRTALSGYANNLVSYIRGNTPAAATQDVIGGKTIIPLAIGTQLRQTALSNAYGTVTDYATMPASFRTTLAITVPGASAVTFNSSDIYGHRISVFFNASNQPVLRLDGTLEATGTAAAASSYVGIGVSVTHPYANSFGNQSGTLSVLSSGTWGSGTYLIGTGWGQVGRGMIERHRKLLAQNQAALPGNATDESVLGESLAMLGYTWLAENARVEQLTDQFAGTSTVYQHAVGIVGMKGVGGSVGPYVDLPMNFLGIIQRVGRAGSGTATAPESAAFFTDASVSSVLESGSLEQTQPGMTAASTVKVLDIVSQSGKIFDINNSAVAGDTCAYYASTIRTQLTGYSAADLARIDSLVNYTASTNSCSTTLGKRVIAAQNGATTINQWTGTGYFQVAQDGSSLGAIITGGLSGGEPATPVSAGALAVNTETSFVASTTSAVSNVINAVQGMSTVAMGAVSDPLNRVSGDYTYNHDDLTVGSGSYPYGLGFQRSYNSGRRLRSGPLGLGWTHNFAVNAAADSDGFAGMGDSSPVNGAAAIAAIYVSQDILNAVSSDAKPVDRMILAVEIERWLMDQLTGNVVVVSQPEMSEQFVKLADGSYNPPIGSASSLSLGTTYSYKTKDQVALAFNSAGQLASWHHPSGPTVSLNYTGSNLTSVSNGMGRTLTLSYDASNRITQVADGTGRSVIYAYDANNDLTTFTDAASHATTYAYDIPGRLTQLFNPAFPSTAFITNTYDSLGRVSVQTDGGNNVTTLYFAGPRTETVDAAGTFDIYYFTSHGRLRAHVDGLGHQTVTTYDGLDRVLTTTLPEGNSVSYTYDAKSNPLTVTSTPKAGSGLTALVSSFTYDPTYNKVTTAKDPLGNVTTNTYDSATGNLLSLQQPAVGGHTPVTAFTYNTRGQVLTVTDAVGKVTRNGYDGTTEALLSTIDDYGRLALTTQFGYDPVGNVTSVTDADGHVTTTVYDALRRKTQVSAPSALDTVAYVYDANGNPTTVTNDPGASPHLNQVSSATWSVLNKKLTATDPSGNKTTYTYDALDRVATQTDAASRVTSYGYDVLSRLATVTNTGIQAGPLESHAYTANGKQASLTDAKGHVTSYAYDGFDRLTTTTYADASTETAAYDADGNVVSKKTRGGNAIVFTYDALNRVSTKAPAGENTVTYAYDLTGRLTSVSDANGAFTYAYDTAGRNVSAARPSGTQVTYTYDAVGNRTRLTWPDAYYVTYAYDALNRMTDIKESGTTPLAHYTYDAASRRTGLSYGNTASASYGYAANNDLTNLTQTFVGSTAGFTYGYNGVHQRTSAAATDGSFLYHPATAASVAYVPNTVNAYSTVAAIGQTYDGNGNLTGDGTFTYAYDSENHLLSAKSTGHGYAYTYDPLGRRARKNLDGVVTVYLSDGDREIGEYDGSGTLLRRYVYGPGLDEPVVTIAVSGTTSSKSFNHQDGLGSVVALSSASGAVGDKYAYSAYGEAASMAGNAYRYAGRRLDAETGLYYNRARFYSPKLGRFLQTDPIGYNGGINLYAYVGNDPLNKVDPSGLAAEASAQSLTSGISNLYGDLRSDPLGTATSILNSFPQLGMGAGVAGLGARGGAVAAEEVGDVAANIANGPRLAGQLSLESANSPFTATGELAQDALNSSRQIIAPSELGNPALPQGVGKFATPTFQSPSGDFQVHFYMNPTTMEPYYGLDYKAIFNASKPFGGS